MCKHFFFHKKYYFFCLILGSIMSWTYSLQVRFTNYNFLFLSYILPDTRKKSRQKTRIIKKTQEPVYNHAMVYDGFRTGEFSEACCELTVWDHNTLSNQFLGGLRLSLGTGNKIFSSLQLYFAPIYIFTLIFVLVLI